MLEVRDEGFVMRRSELRYIWKGVCFCFYLLVYVVLKVPGEGFVMERSGFCDVWKVVR